MDQAGKFKLLYAGILLALFSWVVEIVFGAYMETTKGIWLILNILLFLVAACVMTVAYFRVRKCDKTFMIASVFGIVTTAATVVRLLGLFIEAEGLISVSDMIIGIGAGFAPYFAIEGIRNTISQTKQERSLVVAESGKAVQYCFGIIDALYIIAPVMALVEWLFKLDLSTPTAILDDFTQCLALITYAIFTHFVWECTLIEEKIEMK